MPGYEVFGEEEKKRSWRSWKRASCFDTVFRPSGRAAIRLKNLKKAFAAFTGRKHALAVSSGSTALRVALAALGVGFGDEVITTGFTFVATWEAILETGAVPVFTEIDDTLNMDPKDLEKKITPGPGPSSRSTCWAPRRILSRSWKLPAGTTCRSWKIRPRPPVVLSGEAPGVLRAIAPFPSIRSRP